VADEMWKMELGDNVWDSMSQSSATVT